MTNAMPSVKDDKTLLRVEALAVARRHNDIPMKNIRRIRTICEFAEYFS